MKLKFNHRNGLGCWVNDIKNKPMPNQQWPDVKIYEETIEDYIDFLDLLQKSGYNELTIWGLITSHDWPVDISSALKKDRKSRLNKIINAAHRKGINIIYGLGVHNWGFNKIIDYDPEVRGSNKNALCGSNTKSMEWQERIIDFIVSNLDVDGFHLQSADEGRCRCSLCADKSDIEYFSSLDTKAAKYIKIKWPDKIIDVFMCNYLPWGDYINSSDFKYLYELSKHIDFLIDPGHYGQYIRKKDRKPFISNLDCDFGISGFWVYSPQRWDRLRWFLPYASRISSSIKSLYQDGGRAFESTMGPPINPSTEMNIAFVGKLLSDVESSSDDILMELVDAFYKPKNSSALKSLVNIFINSEEAYFSNWSPCKIPWPIPEHNKEEAIKIRTKTPERITINELMLEPLWGTCPGPPIYLVKNMTSIGRKNYKNELQKILKDILKFEDKITDSRRIERIKISIDSVIKDIDSI